MALFTVDEFESVVEDHYDDFECDSKSSMRVEMDDFESVEFGDFECAINEDDDNDVFEGVIVEDVNDDDFESIIDFESDDFESVVQQHHDDFESLKVDDFESVIIMMSEVW